MLQIPNDRTERFAQVLALLGFFYLFLRIGLDLFRA